jgi:hypothetical protein
LSPIGTVESRIFNARGILRTILVEKERFMNKKMWEWVNRYRDGEIPRSGRTERFEEEAKETGTFAAV